MIFDTHAHYDDARFDQDRHELLRNLPDNGIGLVINVGCTMERSQKSIELAEKYQHVYASVGVHPHDAHDYNINILGDLATKSKVKAIGEIGLDYYENPNHSTNSSLQLHELQQKCFREQMDLARSLNMPVIIHNRDAHEDCLKIIKEFPTVKGVVHCYSGSVETAKILTKMDWMLSFPGVITFSNAKKACEVVKWLPSEYLMIETDCPYMSPAPNRGKRNDSSNLQYIINKIAELRACSAQQVEQFTWENGKRLFRI